MKAGFLIIVLLHGLIHLAGFAKAFGFWEIKNLTLPISKPLGLVWLAATLLFLIYGILYFLNYNYTWRLGLVALILSQGLIIYFWTDAKFGSLPNFIILLAILVSYGNSKFSTLVEKETTQILLNSEVSNIEIFSEKEIKNLPEPVKKWLANSGALGREKTINGKIIQTAKIKMKPEQKNWYSAKAIQYTLVDHPSFIWTVDLKMNSFLRFRGRDKFLSGKGNMLIKLNSLLTIVDESGEKIDEGTMQRYLGEMVWFPSLAVSPFVSWNEINKTTAKATINYKGTNASGVFYFNEEGDFIKFIALRFRENTTKAERKEWILSVDDYSIFEGIKVPSKMKATWKLDEANWNWLELEIVNIEYNINPNLLVEKPEY